MTRRLALLLSHRRFVLAFSIFMFWIIGRASRIGTKSGICPFGDRQLCLAELRLQFLRSFRPFCSFLRTSLHACTQTSNT
ncbi:hypothetical protein H5410_057527 [Solanum commersonii]|uniref:Uncharacterized protein n=1 Tax=Solanum commersonii TaxID=4109 RepID=A0A9J5WNB8_SOLCO|nr:hypothetical protein H5410_057527 [Solanum commersonii]